jgi:polyisoprenoid-binding protein YceI
MVVYASFLQAMRFFPCRCKPIFFAVRHMMVTNVHGQFNMISGTIQFDPAA